MIIQFKKLFQRLCGEQLQWDEPLPDALQREWKTLVDDLRHSSLVSIPRSYHQGILDSVCSYSLCGFCDASTTAYAAVIYLVAKTETSTHTQFLASKTRVAPIQTLTIPRLDAVSSVLDSAIPDFMIECYTDSTVALHWIRGTTKEWKPFVQNRVNEIRQKITPDRWKHCAGVTNPADLPSRGITIAELHVSRLWRFGPDWLGLGQISDDHPEMPGECLDELKASSKQSHSLDTTEVKPTIGELIECARFSSFSRLVRVTAYVLRAVETFKSKRASQGSSPLSTEELADAECRWIEDSQMTLNCEDSFDSLRLQLNLFLDENGLWRYGGRLANANLPYFTKYPLMLPRNHPLTPLIVNDAHRHVLHNGYMKP